MGARVAERCVRLLALATFALPWERGVAVDAVLVAIGQVLWKDRAPKAPAIALAAISVSALLPALPPGLWKLADSFASLVSGSIVVGWSVLGGAGSLALGVSAFLGSARRGTALLVGHGALSLVFLRYLVVLGVPGRIDEPSVLLAVVVYRTTLWGLVGLDLLSRQEDLRPRSGRAVLPVGGAAAICALTLTVTTAPDARPLRVCFLWPNPGTPAAQEYRTAASGYGFVNAGLYGEWARVLERAGHRVLKQTRLDHASLAGSDLLIIASAFREWLPGERETVVEWVRGGGRLVLVGEHTDLEGCQRLFNPLLSEFGLVLNFDTTNGLLGDGLRGVILAPDPLGRLLMRAPLLPYGRGASLEVRDGARPLLIGRYWHVDAGDPLAPERAFLSDYRLSARDRIGDVLLMAMHEDRGRLLAIGDSTPFLNQNTLYASRFLLELVHYMGRAVSRLDRWIAPAVAVLFGLLVYSLEARRNGMAWAFGALAVGLLWPQPEPPYLGRTQRLAIVSTRENNVFDSDAFSARSPTALGLALSRLDMTPLLGDWERLDRRPEIIALLNPAEPPRPPAVERLESWIREGTTLVLAGDGDNARFREWARGFGTEVSERPLGSVKAAAFTTYSAWEVSSLPPGAEALTAEDFLVGGVTRLGAGRIIVFADGGFFLSKNLEMESAFDAKNIDFVRKLLSAEARRDAERN